MEQGQAPPIGVHLIDGMIADLAPEGADLTRRSPLLEAIEDLLEEAEDASLGDAVDGSDHP